LLSTSCQTNRKMRHFGALACYRSGMRDSWYYMLSLAALALAIGWAAVYDLRRIGGVPPPRRGARARLCVRCGDRPSSRLLSPQQRRESRHSATAAVGQKAT
jgi:hypothetical protein